MYAELHKIISFGAHTSNTAPCTMGEKVGMEKWIYSSTPNFIPSVQLVPQNCTVH